MLESKRFRLSAIFSLSRQPRDLMPTTPPKIDFEVQENVPLAPLTTLRIGGPARFFVKAVSEKLVVDTLEFAAEKRLEVFVLGGGSNILVSDAGFDGLVVQIAINGVTQNGQEAGLEYITVGAGEDWDRFVEYCVDQNLAGVECLSGIPGSVGGTPVQNVGAYGQEVSETIVSVRCLDRMTGKIVQMTNEDCGFSYRKSIFNSTEREKFIVLGVKYALRKGGEAAINYKDLKEIFNDRRPTLREAREAVLRIRRAKSMVIDPADPNSRSAGSFFKNPIVSVSKFELVKKFENSETVPGFPIDKNTIKIPAAWLIERAGFYKGFRLGNAGISANHSLAIVNLGGATAQEVLDLKDRIQAAIRERFGIELVPEPVFVGF